MDPGFPKFVHYVSTVLSSSMIDSSVCTLLCRQNNAKARAHFVPSLELLKGSDSQRETWVKSNLWTQKPRVDFIKDVTELFRLNSEVCLRLGGHDGARQEINKHEFLATGRHSCAACGKDHSAYWSECDCP